ncbi:phage tail tape measure protein [Streptomyces roseoverticillatus]|uniref:phage tail tape measure protein n=1 Tax=Streptomyces roseoverticillatus TaxID=66429 RepID=UPI001F1FCA9D|nr:phage tail tape measure protein [Streptomyces roseoverticillatus]MCF3101419.1 phage tail tape measure protein [Streptomyces roseoverticillatus]
MNVVEILITAKNLTGPAMADSVKGLSAVDNAMKKVHQTSLAAVTGLAVLGAESVKMAATFDSKMALLQTQAGVSKDKIAGLSKGVLDLAGKVGQDPNSLAESLFHVESNFESMGITSKKALELVEVAAKGATTGHANLVDVTNALTAAVASGIPGVQNFDQAMGVLNATVGVGDMKMQDLANAFGSGMVATVKGFGLNIADVGAALAVFGDNNIRGALAGNQLRMSVMALANPVKGSGDALAKLGLSTDTLAKDMQRGGLKLALEDLVDRMHKAGISSKEQGQIITDAFGRKAGAGLNVLVSQMDRLESKYPALEKGAKGFGKSWEETQKTFAFQAKQLQTSFDALMISMGEKIIPVLQRIISFLLQHKDATLAVVGALGALLAITMAVSIGMKAAAVATFLFRDSQIAAEAGLSVSRIGAAAMVAQLLAVRAAQMAAAAGAAVWTGAQAAGVAVMTAFLHPIATAQAGITALGARFAALQAASAAAGGGLAGLKAAFLSLGTAARAGVVVAGIAGLVVALTMLSNIGKKAPPDADRMATAITNLGRSGRVSGEALRVYGKDLGGLADSLRTLSRPSGLDKTQQFLTSLVGMDSTPVKNAKQNIDALDKSLAGLVKAGRQDLAAAAFKDVAKAMEKQGLSGKELKSQLTAYKDALASSDAQQKLTAESMGRFGAEAITTQQALEAQKSSAEGLRQSLQALNDVNRKGLGGMIAFEQSIADAAASAKTNAGALSMSHGELKLTSQKARDAATSLQNLAARTDEATSAALDQGKSWDTVNAIYARGHSQLIAAARAMGLNADQAKTLADSILKIPPSKTTTVKGNVSDVESKISSAKALLKGLPDSRKASVRGTLADIQAKLDSAKAQLKSVPDSRRAALRAQIGQLEQAVAQAKAQLASVHDKTVTITTYRNFVEIPQTPWWQSGHFASGGLIRGPGTGTSDDVPLMGSDGEFVVKASSVKKYGTRFLDAINQGTLRMFASGGKVSEEAQQARSQMGGDLTVSYYGQMAGWKRSEFAAAMDNPNSLGDLADSLNNWRGLIKNAFSGGTEKSLQSALSRTGAQLIKQEQALTKVNTALDSARDKLNSLKDKFAQAKDQVASGIMSAANITGAVQSGKRTSLGDIMNDLVSNRDKAVSLDAALKTLRARGLNSSSLQEIAQGGVDSGLKTAEALMGASKSDLKRINQLRTQIGSAASSAGQTTADALYGAEIKQTQKLVSSLEKTHDKLRQAMERVAASMEKVLEKALGIKGKFSGGVTGAAGGGPRSGWTLLGEQGPEIAELPAGAMIRTANYTRRALAAASGSGGGTVVLEVKSGGSRMDDLLVELLRGAIRVRGGNVQAVLGRAGA